MSAVVLADSASDLVAATGRARPSVTGGIGFDWPFDLAQGRAELEFWAGIGFDWVCFEWRLLLIVRCSLA